MHATPHRFHAAARTLGISLLACALAPAAPQDDLILVQDGRTTAVIVIPADAPESVRVAGEELQRLILACTGADMPVVDTVPENRACIVLGNPPEAAAMGPVPDEHDGYAMRTDGKRVFLRGRDDDVSRVAPRPAGEIGEEEPCRFYNLKRWRRSLSAGTYNAAMEFCRRYLGVRWFMPGPLGEEAPRGGTLAVPAALDERVVPAFPMRRLNFTDHNEAEFARALAGELHDYDVDLITRGTQWGRHLGLTNDIVLGNGHGWRHWIPANELSAPWIAEPIGLQPYGTTHPEYFALVNGTRQTTYVRAGQQGGQLCVSNPEVVATYADNIIRYARLTPGIRMFSLSQNDGGMHCECPGCAALDPEPIRGTGDVESRFLTDRIVRFQNTVAERVLEQIPDARFLATAYHGTARAPVRERLHPSIHLIQYFNYLPYRYHLPAKRAELENALEGWADRADNIVFSSFYFAYGNYGFPWSTPDVHRWTVDLMRRHGHKGMSMYFAADKRPMVGALGPDIWLLAELLRNPEADAQRLLDEWYGSTFGPAAGSAVRDYYEIIDRRMVAEVARYPEFFARRADSQRRIDLAVYMDVRAPCAERIARAREAVKDAPERYRWRVEQIARNWDFVELTLDAVEATRQSRITPSVESFEKALALGERRKAWLYDRENRFAVCPEAAEESDRHSSLGIVDERPTVRIPTLRVPRTSGEPVIDGMLRDPIWTAEAATIGNDPDTRFRNNATLGPAMPDLITQATVTAGAKGLYIMMWGAEPYMEELKTVDDPERVWEGDVFEVFIAPAGGDGGFRQFLVNPNGVGKAIAHRGDTGQDTAWNPTWTHAGARFPKGWGVELFLPWETLGRDAPPGPGETWIANFCRERYTRTPELQAWSPTGGAFAMPHRFGRLIFR